MLKLFLITLASLVTPAIACAASVPITLVNNHVIVDVRLNGTGPFRFVVDSGAGNLVDPSVAAQIGARIGGHVRLVGVGATTETGGVTTIARVAIGEASFRDERFVVAQTHATLSAAEGLPIDGLIGRSIIGSGITVFDYANERLTFAADERQLVDGGTTIVPVTLRDGLLQIPCSIAGVGGDCTVDTGSRLAVSVLGRFVKRHPEITPRSLSARGVDGYGVGGAAYGRLGLLPSLTLGSVTLPNVVADYSTQERGVFADESTAANVGGAVWRRFTLVFDLAHARIGLRPNDNFSAPYRIDRSGLFLVARAGAIAVLDVRAQTPAERAGFRAGDTIVSADGRRYPSNALTALRGVLEGPAHTLVQLQIMRGNDAPRSIGLQLDDYL